MNAARRNHRVLRNARLNGEELCHNSEAHTLAPQTPGALYVPFLVLLL